MAKNNGIPEKVRYNVNLDTVAQLIIEELADLWHDHYVLDRAMASGQLVSAIEQHITQLGISPKNKIWGCELFEMDVQYAINFPNRKPLEGNYIHTGNYMIEPKFDGISFLPGERDFKYIEIGNYPYNDGSINNTVIWNEFITRAQQNKADAVAVVVQASFLAQQFKGLSKKVKLDLMKLGCYKIAINDYADFSEDLAKVKTCILFCRRGYQGPVTYVERSSGLTVTQSLELPFDMIFDSSRRQFLDAVDNARPTQNAAPFGSFAKFPKWKELSTGEQQKYCIGSYYRTEGFDKNPLKGFKILHPADGLAKDHYVIFGKADTEAEAKILLEKLNSFWFNDAVQAILLLTRYQISLDATQYSRVPKTPVDHVFGEDELFDLWQIPDGAKTMAKEITAGCEYKKQDEDETNN